MKDLVVKLILFGVAGIVCHGDEIISLNFTKGIPGNFIVSQKGNTALNEKAELALRDGAKISTKSFTVESFTAYRLSFSAKVEGPGNFEDSPQLEYLFMNPDKTKTGRTLAGWKIKFMDKQGSEIKPKHARFWHYVFSKDFLRYQDEFYTPRDSALLSLEFCAGEPNDSLLIREVKLEKILPQETLNFNPGFKLGQYNYSGFNQVYKGKIIADNDGTFKFDLSKGWAIGEDIPVKPGEKIKVSVSGKFFKPMGAVFKFNYYDAAGKEISRDHGILRIPQGKEMEVNYDFIVPANAAAIRFILGGCIYNFIKINRISE